MTYGFQLEMYGQTPSVALKFNPEKKKKQNNFWL